MSKINLLNWWWSMSDTDHQISNVYDTSGEFSTEVSIINGF